MGPPMNQDSIHPCIHHSATPPREHPPPHPHDPRRRPHRKHSSPISPGSSLRIDVPGRGSCRYATTAPRMICALPHDAFDTDCAPRQDTISAAALCFPLYGWFAIENCIPVLASLKPPAQVGSAFRRLPSPTHVVPVAPWIPRLRATAGQSLGCHPFTSSHLPLPATTADKMCYQQ